MLIDNVQLEDECSFLRITEGKNRKQRFEALDLAKIYIFKKSYPKLMNFLEKTFTQCSRETNQRGLRSIFCGSSFKQAFQSLSRLHQRLQK